MTYKILTCPKCGDDDICCDATATWNAKLDEWDVVGTMDSFTCEACGEEFSAPDEIDIGDRFYSDSQQSVEIVVRPVRSVDGAFEMCEPADAERWGVYWREADEYGMCVDVHMLDKPTKNDAAWWVITRLFASWTRQAVCLVFESREAREVIAHDSEEEAELFETIKRKE